MEPVHTAFKTSIRTNPPATEAIDPRLAAEVEAINAAFDKAAEALDADRKAIQHKSTAPIKIAEFPA